MRRTLLLLASVTATILTTSFANATMWITQDRGGRIIEYAERFMQARAAGEQVVIDGACLSACTLVVGMLPRDHVCATPRAVLGFHAAWRPTADGGRTSSDVATRAMMDVYPAGVRSWIGRHGGLTPRMIFLQGRELAAMVPTCGSVATLASGVPRVPRVRRTESRITYAAQQAR
jgi:hypothetical protein